MQAEGVQPDSFTSVGVLNTCASLVALEEGRDCCSSTKFILKIVGRASMVRDVTHFQEWVCSCMDYW
ncbi:unnamed protein product [Sphagnum tenellum]